MIEKLTFIGAGAMAEALISGIVSDGLLEREKILATNKNDPKQLQALKDTYGIRVSEDTKEAMKDAEAVILAVKPKDSQAALEEIKPYLGDEAVVISVMAGVSTQSIQEMLGKSQPVIRVMPNTSAMIKESATAICQGTYATEADLNLAQSLLKTVGLVDVVKESDIDAITAIAGSGPAYMYYVVEAMMSEGVELGLDEDVSEAFVYQTILGAAKMLQASSDSPKTLREKITSPNGTTEAGLRTLDEYNVSTHIKEAVRAAHKRSIELGNQ
ncbi:pyrroline-5-carboxylate reductase [Pelagirhabdus alkalitolerans]|uniref:Pyrroline-5-carboxylate reductase n=1 Tax=Pelagirhabdus alkalitolerans TaxID=1612202 RepID=A0A1G6NGD6_9BACI|nr:pyrroline-5-carboxylate reductase [Pelagirhabdus alkalitolerans]SDC66396.1 pyrroline-5-carboxylate reductase [Pelagirhabdus alkalitolerans]